MIFLDMDGVCVDFTTAALKAHGSNLTDKDITSYGMHIFLGMTAAGLSGEEFWRPIDALGVDFWTGLQPYPWFTPLCEMIDAAGETFTFVSDTSLSAYSAMGKQLWLEEVFGHDFDRYVFTKYKHLLARPDRLLIDDKPENVRLFAEAGGRSLLFPMPWNSPPTTPEEKIQRVQIALDKRTREEP